MNRKPYLRCQRWLPWALVVLISLPAFPVAADTPWDRFQKKRREIQRKVGHALTGVGRKIEQFADRVEDSWESSSPTPPSRRPVKKTVVIEPDSGIKEESPAASPKEVTRTPSFSEKPEEFKAATPAVDIFSTGTEPVKEPWVDRELEAAVENGSDTGPLLAPVPKASAAGQASLPKSGGGVVFGHPVPGKPGFVYPPGVSEEGKNMIDVRDFKSGQQVRDPRTGRLFRVP